MTVAATLALRDQEIEYILCVEGIGWPSNWSDLSETWDGDVFVTADLNGDLATQLGCTIHTGLRLPSGITRSFDPRTAEYSISGLDVRIVDDGWWLSNYTPRKEGTTDWLSAALEFRDTAIRTIGAPYSEGDIVWIGGRECVKLGSIFGDDYVDSTRAYLGTRRGTVQRSPSRASHGTWASGTSITTVPIFWRNRKVALFAHVAGDVRGNCLLLWFGVLRGLTSDISGIEYDLQCASDFLQDVGRVWRPKEWVIVDDQFRKPWGDTRQAEETDFVAADAMGYRRHITFYRPGGLSSDGYANDDEYSLPLAYRYRSEPGGLQGAITEWDAGTIQALDTNDEDDVIMSFVQAGDDVLLMIRRDSFVSNAQPHRVAIETFSSAGTSDISSPGGSDDRWSAGGMNLGRGARARFLLAHWFNEKEFERYTVNGKPLSHPIDIFLCHFLSTDRELFRADATGGSAAVPTFADCGPADLWIGYALHCMEGNNKWEAREITDNDATSITVARAFSNAPTAATEYQVRNSIYDVLPYGWGLGADAKKVDVDSFLAIRDTHLSDAVVGRFILGVEGEVDIWEMLRDNILIPYGIIIGMNYNTGLITATYAGHALGDGIIDDYVAITESEILAPGRLNNTFVSPVGTIELNTRTTEDRVVGFEFVPGPTITQSGIAPVRRKVPTVRGNDRTVIEIRSQEMEAAFSDNDLDKLSFNAMFNTIDNLGPLSSRLAGLIGEYAVSPPVWQGCELDVDLWPSLHPAVYVSITWAEAPANPYTGARGWSQMVGRVLDMTLALDRLALVASIELMATIDGGRIAPATTITGKGTVPDTNTLAVNDYDFVLDEESDKDFYHFAVGDRCEIRSKAGTVDGVGTVTIASFGTNEATTPQAAATSQINLNESLAAYSYTAGDYLTFAPWSGSNTARMEEYSAYADSNGDLAGGDTARKYA